MQSPLIVRAKGKDESKTLALTVKKNEWTVQMQMSNAFWKKVMAGFQDERQNVSLQFLKFSLQLYNLKLYYYK